MHAEAISYAHLIPRGGNTITITDKLRKEIFKAWGGKCAYCRVREAEHADHIFTRAKGGPNTLENLAASCETCNQMKSDMVLGEGLLEIIFAKAKKKAPAIRRAMAPKRKSTIDRTQLISDLADALFALNEQSGDPIKCRDTIQLEVEAEFGDKSNSEVKQQAAKYRGTFRRRAKEKSERIATETLLAQIHKALINSGCCETAARMILKKKETRGELSTSVKMRRVLSKLVKQSPAECRDRIDIGMTADIRAEFRDVIRSGTVLDFEGQPVFRFDTKSHPKLAHHFLSYGPRPHARIKGWMINLISGWDTYIDLGVIQIYEPPHPEILAQALDRCHEMGTDAFIFRNPFEQFCIPPKEFCQSVSAVSV